MPTFVIKKDGGKAPFDAEKITHSIMSACDDAGIEDMEKETITKEIGAAVFMSLENKDQVSTTEIKAMILEELEASHPSIADAWKKYEEDKLS